jgi:1-acyl-sn-glycerol-3-phosphate acyltransferase
VRSSGTIALPKIRKASRSELWFYAFCRTIVVGLSRLFFVGGVIGKENIPKTGPFVLAPIHRSYIDWFIAARVTRRRLRFLVKGEVWKFKPAGVLLEMLGAFPVQRGAADRDALKRALEVLKAGEPLVVFPEGTRGSGATIENIREGAAYLALRAGVPVVPVGMAGVERAMPRGSSWIRPAHVVVVVGKPIASALADEIPGEGSGRVPRSRTTSLTEEIRIGIELAQAEAESHIKRPR